MDEQQEPKRKKGPKPGPKTMKATVLLEPELVDWAKEQPEGMSGLVRDLIKAERERREGGE